MAERITRADVVDAAMELLAEGGLPALAMRRIAGELGIQQSALYWHFDNKQQLLSAVADQIVATVQPAGDDDWATRIAGMASRLRTTLLAYPDGAELVATAIAFRLGGRDLLARCADGFAAAGLDADDAETAASVLVHFVLGYTNDEQQHEQAAALGAIDPVAPDRPARDARFVAGIDLIVAGVERRSAIRPTSRRRR